MSGATRRTLSQGGRSGSGGGREEGRQFENEAATSSSLPEELGMPLIRARAEERRTASVHSRWRARATECKKAASTVQPSVASW